MAAFTDLDDYKARLRNPTEMDCDARSTFTTLAGRLFSLWTAGGNETGTGVAPTTAVVPSRTLAGSAGQGNPASGKELFMPRLDMNRVNGGLLILCDRLSHQGGLSGTVSTAQTTNLPTAALTRYTDGVGVQAALEIYTQVGTTAASATISYTNESGTSGRTSTATTFGATSWRTNGRFVQIPLAAGDYGVRAVASVTLSVTTGTAGNFGVTLYKPLISFPAPLYGNQNYIYDAIANQGGQLPKILTDACLFWLYMPITTASGVHTSEMIFTDR